MSRRAFQANLIAYVLFRSVGELYQYLNEKVGALSGVDSVETALIVRQLKQLANAMPQLTTIAG